MNNTNKDFQKNWGHIITLVLAICAIVLVFFFLIKDYYSLAVITIFLGIGGLIPSGLQAFDDELRIISQRVSLISFLIFCGVTIISIIYFFHSIAIFHAISQNDVVGV